MLLGDDMMQIGVVSDDEEDESLEAVGVPGNEDVEEYVDGIIHEEDGIDDPQNVEANLIESMNSNENDEVNSIEHEYVQNLEDDNEVEAPVDHSDDIASEYGATDEAIDIFSNDVQTNVNQRPKRANAGAGINRLEMNFDGKEYPSVFTK